MTIAIRSQQRTKPRASLLARSWRWVVLALISAFALLIASPLLILLLSAFRERSDYATNGPLSIPQTFTFSAFERYLESVNFPLALANSIIISLVVAVVGVVLSLFAAYAIGIGRIRGGVIVTAIMLFATMLPQEATIYPLFFGAQALGIRDSIWSVVIIFSVLQAAFGTYLLGSLMSTFPPALLEAARLDGASQWQILWRVVFPIVRPTLSVLIVFFFIWTWNEFYVPAVMLTDPSNQTVPIALSTVRGQFSTDMTQLNAGSLISLLPTLVFFLIFQRTLTRGVTAGSVK